MIRYSTSGNANYQENANLNKNITSHLLEIAIIKKTRNNYWQGGREKGTPVYCWGECKLVQPLWKRVQSFAKKLKKNNGILHLSEGSDATGLPQAPSWRRAGHQVFSSPHLPRHLLSIFWSLHCVPTSHPSSSITCFLVCKAHRLLATEPNVSSSFKRSFPKLWDLHPQSLQKSRLTLLREGLKYPQEQILSVTPLFSLPPFSSGSLCICLSQNSHARWAHSSPLIAL